MSDLFECFITLALFAFLKPSSFVFQQLLYRMLCIAKVFLFTQQQQQQWQKYIGKWQGFHCSSFVVRFNNMKLSEW